MEWSIEKLFIATITTNIWLVFVSRIGTVISTAAAAGSKQS